MPCGRAGVFRRKCLSTATEVESQAFCEDFFQIFVPCRRRLRVPLRRGRNLWAFLPEVKEKISFFQKNFSLKLLPHTHQGFLCGEGGIYAMPSPLSTEIFRSQQKNSGSPRPRPALHAARGEPRRFPAGCQENMRKK